MKFTDRKQLKVYLEKADLERLEGEATEVGKTVSEYAREKLLAEPTAGKEESGDDRVPELPGGGEVREARRREPVATKPLGGPCDHDFGYGPGKCPYAQCRNANPKAVARCKHGTEKGYRCWQCGGKAVVE
jgi:hypothetical protein